MGESKLILNFIDKIKIGPLIPKLKDFPMVKSNIEKNDYIKDKINEITKKSNQES